MENRWSRLRFEMEMNVQMEIPRPVLLNVWSGEIFVISHSDFSMQTVLGQWGVLDSHLPIRTESRRIIARKCINCMFWIRL
jgi:hypothetical protein